MTKNWARGWRGQNSEGGFPLESPAERGMAGVCVCGDHDPVLWHVQFYNKWKDFEGSGNVFWKAVDILVEV